MQPNTIRRLIVWSTSVFLGILLLCAVFLALLFHRIPPPVIHTDPTAARQLTEEMQKAQMAAAAGGPGVVRAGETQLNSMLEQYLRTASGNSAAPPVRDMKLSLYDDRLQLYLATTLEGRDVTVLLEGKVRTLNGHLEFIPLGGKIGALPIPKSSLIKAVQQMTASNDTRELLRLPPNLRDLHIEDGKLVVEYK